MTYKMEYRVMELPDGYDITMNSPANVENFLRERFSPVQEEMHLMCMNIKNRVILHRVIARGAYNTLSIEPREIFIPVLTNCCKNFIIAHNHPSNDTSPSKEDIIMTKKLEKGCGYVGLNMLDHLIFTADDAYSFKKHGLI